MDLKGLMHLMSKRFFSGPCGPALSEEEDASSDALRRLRALRPIAAPSWVISASLYDNCRFLCGKVDEVGLVFFETDACLAYGEDDLPADLALLPLRFHVHLPLDLPWHEPWRAADICHALLERVAFLPGTARGLQAVLHPPESALGDGQELLSAFVERYLEIGGKPGLLLLENIPENDLSGLAGLMREADLGLCIDLGHMLACGQESVLFQDCFIERTRMLHLSAPGCDAGRIRHLPLSALDPHGLAIGRALCERAPQDALLMLELFSWSQVQESLPVLCSWLLPGS